eukprot:CAMPEP_0117658772 /NCGR_PEP_ID=MMETSP0804-20121206/6047_1 /TAXON_ID=1074897 /ORGANISM="Tetraselmis astigmatica, Strain CCMP880" /LENGTH=87 /DNA_ID=CAMNT_0005465325 /DNA_START=386 /DNA_END=649 /DNA_ORIENTATION=-
MRQLGKKVGPGWQGTCGTLSGWVALPDCHSSQMGFAGKERRGRDVVAAQERGKGIRQATRGKGRGQMRAGEGKETRRVRDPTAAYGG